MKIYFWIFIINVFIQPFLKGSLSYYWVTYKNINHKKPFESLSIYILRTQVEIKVESSEAPLEGIQFNLGATC